MVSVVDSLVAPLSVINALVVALCLKCPEQVRKNLETLEETWNNYQVYLNDEIDFIDDEPMLDYSLRRRSSDVDMSAEKDENEQCDSGRRRGCRHDGCHSGSKMRT